MKTGVVLLLMFLAGFNPTLSAAGQAVARTPLQQALRQWADPETVENWTRAIRAAIRQQRANQLDEAATLFRGAVTVCQRKASKGIHQCIARLMLAEVLLEMGNVEEATVQVNQLATSLKKATRYADSGMLDNPKRIFEESVANAYRYQVGAALSMRCARICFRLGNPQLAESFFDTAIRIFEQKVHRHSVTLAGLEDRVILNGNLPSALYFYPERHLRVAEILEARSRFNLVGGQEALALTHLRRAEEVKKTPPPVDNAGSPVRQTELFLDQLVAEPLDKSFLKRFLEDCAFYRFDDARIADLLVRQAALLRKVSRNDEATAFERFAESLRKKPLNQ